MTVTIDGLTKDRMLAIEAESIVGGVVNGVGHLILSRHDGAVIDAGNVIGPQGPPYVNGVDTVSNQAIDGIKTFIKTPIVPSVDIKTAQVGVGRTIKERFLDNAGVLKAEVGVYEDTKTYLASKDAAGRIVLEVNGNDLVTLDANGMVNINRTGLGVALKIGQGIPAGGGLNALNITPYGAAAVVFASGAERDAAGNSVGRAGSATQIEMLNSGINLYCDTGTVVGANYTRTRRMQLDTGGHQVGGQVHGFGLGAIGGAAGTYLQFDATATEVYVRAFGTPADIPIIVQPKGNSQIQLRSGSGRTALAIQPIDTVLVNVNNGAAVAAHGIDVQCSPSAGYAVLNGRSQWGVGAGGDLLGLSNAIASVFHIDGNGMFNWEAGANLAGILVGTATAGGTGPLPATVRGYLVFKSQGTIRKIPYYDN